MTERLIEILEIEKGDLVAITGSGGKTSLMMALAADLKNFGSVLISPSTKIGLPSKGQVDYVFTSLDHYQSQDYSKKILVLGEKIPAKDKLAAIDQEALREISKDFAYVLVEADGARRLPLKFWQPYEPVIYDFSTKAVAVFPLKVLGREAGSDFIYNYPAFQAQIKDQVISKGTIEKLILSKPGPFADFAGPKYVFISQVESQEEIQRARDLVGYLRDKFPGIKFFYGSTKEHSYYED
ncbi:MAG: selenium cofactor biosynthesis protein YqeC [Bacillota bacterium]|nr:selenium cofactor biosynthesis protein YqeC [Bacillota bacterium]